MNRIYNGAAIPRYQVFVLDDGEFVVQWNETSVQNLMTGQYRPYTFHDFGHLIHDFELERLKTAGVIEHYNRTYVWIYALPENNRFGGLRTQEHSSGRVRLYYLNTTLPASRFDEVLDRFQTLNLMDQYWATEHDGVVAIFGKDEKPFVQLKDAESVQRQLSAVAPDLFGATAVAFIEMSRSEVALKSPELDSLDLDVIIAAQSDTTTLKGKRAVVIVKDDRESHEICQQLGSLLMDVCTARTGSEALQVLQEQPPHVVVMELQLPDMHGYEMLAKVREMNFSVRVIVLAEPSAAESDQVFALTIARVDGYLVKPISLPLLRQTVWEALKE
ncbi:MAG: response regulator [Anaerolinea sp.]|nr:response regulator [Anaerolinea sp.]